MQSAQLREIEFVSGRPVEIAELIRWLCTDDAAVLHGAVLDASLGLGLAPGMFQPDVVWDLLAPRLRAGRPVGPADTRYAPDAEPANEPGTAEPAALTAPEGGTGGATETQPEPRVSVKEQLLAACEAADYWLRAELQRPGETRPDDILRTLRAAIDRACQQPRRTVTEHRRQSRTDTKQARLIAMLHRGATISDMASELGWLRHTCHGALAGLKKKRGLRITSDKHGGEQVYHIATA